MTDQPTIHPERERLEPLMKRLTEEGDTGYSVDGPIICAINPDGPEAWREIEHLLDRLAKAEAALEATDERVERVARAMIAPLGYAEDTDWDATWVGDVTDNFITGRLHYLCNSLARAAIEAMKP